MGVRIALTLRDTLEQSDVEVSGFDLLHLTKARARQFKIPVAERGYWPEGWGACARIFGRPPDWWHATDIKGEWGEYAAERDRGKDVQEVRLQKRPVSARIVTIESHPAAQVTRKRRNTSDHRGTFQVELEDSVSVDFSRTASNEWAVGSETTVGVEIGGELAQAKTKVEQTISFGYTRGEETTRAKGEAISVADSIEVELGPGEEAIASLSASRGAIIVDVDYDCALVGQGMFSFNKRHHNGHRDWFVDIIQVLNELGYSNNIRVIERMSLGFVSDGVATLANA